MRFAASMLLGAALVSILASDASALPPLPTYVGEHYQASPEYAKFAATFQAQKAKCNTCHQPGADKKAKGHGLNDFGEATHKHLKDKEFLAAHKEAKDNAEKAALAKKLVAEALAAAEGEKNAAGKTYGELIKAGELPGTNK